MNHCASNTDDALHGTWVPAVGMLGCQAGCVLVEEPAKESTCPAAAGSVLGPVSHQHLQPLLHSAGSRSSGQTGEGRSDSRGFWGLWMRSEAWGPLPASLSASGTLI